MSLKLRCGECGDRKFERKNVKGQFSAPWRDFSRAYLTKDLNLLICGNCGNYAIVDDDAKKIDESIESSIRDQAAQFIDIIKSKTGISSATLAFTIGISPEYLSTIYNQKQTPKFQLWNLLKVIAGDPVKLIAELDPNRDFRKENLLLRA